MFDLGERKTSRNGLCDNVVMSMLFGYVAVVLRKSYG
jgi:hypothetical protein